MVPKLARSVALLFFGLVLTSATPSHGQVSGVSSPRVISIHEVKLKSGVSAEDFERDYINLYAPAVAKHIPGLRTQLVKGERGAGQGKYFMLHEFDSIERRNAYYPQPGVTSELYQRLSQALPREHMLQYIDLGDYTDYVILQ